MALNGIPKWLKWGLAACGLLLAVAAALPFLVPLDGYIPQLEQAASAGLGQPVSIRHVRLVALPTPHITLEGIAVGKGAGLKVRKLRATPALLTLMQSTRVVRRIDIDGLTATQQALASLVPAGMQPQGAAQFRIERVFLNGARIEFGKVGIGPFDARLDLDERGVPHHATLATSDGKLKANVKSTGANYLIDVRAKSWTPPLGPPLLFDELAIEGTATANGADLSTLNAKLYGGSVRGKAKLDWRDGLQLKGNLDIRQLEVQQVTSMLSPGTHLSGRLDAQPVFSASASSSAQLMDALHLEAPFDVKNGVLHGVDIEQAASKPVRQGTGGETKFEQLSGHLVMERGSYHFTQIKITSGSLVVDGDVSISPEKKLSGRIDAQVTALGNVPLNVGGTVDSPLLYPTGATMTGAAIGTMILGPGVGTSVGAKIGGFVGGLFGKNKTEPKPKK